MNEALVSVVVVSYNQGQYINQILDSLQAQTYTNWELIVADDASSDDSVSVFENWLHQYNISAKKIFHTKNTGLATVLNEAIELCAGKYVKLIAADDYMHPECLEKSVKCLEEKSNEYGMVFSDTFCVDEKNNLLPDIADYNALGNISPDDFRKSLLVGNRIAALTVLMKTDVVKETGLYDSKFIVEDYYRWLKISEKYLIAYISEKLTYYRWHDNNISKTKADRINTESLMLKMMFDKKGHQKIRINESILSQYFAGSNIPSDVMALYAQYPFHIKRLLFCIKYHLPPILYRTICKII